MRKREGVGWPDEYQMMYLIQRACQMAVRETCPMKPRVSLPMDLGDLGPGYGGELLKDVAPARLIEARSLLAASRRLMTFERLKPDLTPVRTGTSVSVGRARNT